MDQQLVALDPHQMSQAQTSLIEWCVGKLTALEGEKIQAHGIIEALRAGKMSDARGRRPDRLAGTDGADGPDRHLALGR